MRALLLLLQKESFNSLIDKILMHANNKFIAKFTALKIPMQFKISADES